MKTIGLASVAATVLSGSLFAKSVAAADLPPIVIKGSHFFYENGTEFFIKGIAYQRDVSSNGTVAAAGSAEGVEPTTFTDPLADTASCTRDIPLMAALGVNTIRVYAINATSNHDVCMNLLADNGIYLIQDLSNPKSSIIRNAPQWNTELFATYAGVIDALAGYSNTLGFFAGNEVSNERSNTDASAFVKAAVRDSKTYIKNQAYRTIGVGYATNDDAEIRDDLAAYFNCGDADEAIDFWGYNIYSWCGKSTFTESGYDQRTKEFEKFSVPAFFAEYGCNTIPGTRPFTEVEAIYGPNMTNVWSGGIMYMYFQEANDYGVVSISGTSASKLPDYTALSSQLNAVTPKNTPSASYVVSNTAVSACPTTGTAWAASSNLPPIANSQLCSCMISSLSCVANGGLTGNQTADLFDTVCGLDLAACAGITANGTTGVYGAYSMCTASEKLSFAMNQYYLSQDSASTACSFGGNAEVKSAASAASSCSALLSAAGTAGTGTVTAAPTGAAGSTSAATSKAAAGMVTVPNMNMGSLSLGAYITVAMLAGAGVVLL
ncbi:putative 1,3-beta-glucanosyltransferase gel4 [Amylocarpus encephaloides]|uniref:1,3-beta-glucanosyltransferase n=1 Tax=Amylocarpus encephaloides TaxID=45428 RepID=A0A9P7YR30_9HELO|nr:putative 1,3-beta-glucanosyltransferase gel4 [Amylocarpus encephaloides]